MAIKLTGGCSCRAITYTCSSAPKFSLICQCRQCQRITGSGHAAQFAVDLKSTSIIGSPASFELTSDAGSKVRSAFCSNCGNPVFKSTSMMPDVVLFHAATLDDPSVFRPTMVVNAEFAQPWDHVDPTIG